MSIFNMLKSNIDEVFWENAARFLFMPLINLYF